MTSFNISTDNFDPDSLQNQTQTKKGKKGQNHSENTSKEK